MTGAGLRLYHAAMRRLALAPLAVLLALAACATPAQRISTKLQEYGVPRQQSDCMGDKLQQRLSVSQLQRLNSISKIDSAKFGHMSISDIAKQLSDPRDAAIAAEVIRAGVGCTF
jgi:hypothetical protein